MNDLTSNQIYVDFLAEIKTQIKSSQAKAALAVNSALIEMYWNIGEMIAGNQALFEGGNDYIDRLAKDIQTEFPGIGGFSKRNLFDIRRFYLFYNESSVRQAVALNDAASPTAESLVEQYRNSVVQRKRPHRGRNALRDINKPIGVSEFNFTESLPEELKSEIPTVEEFENELNKLDE